MPKPPSDSMPEIVFLGPKRCKIKHQLVVFVVRERDADGIPRKLELLLNEDTVNVEEGMAFLTGYIQSQCIRPN